MQHAETLKRLREMGISVAIDDFGTGYSCLSYLPKLAFNALKIDRSFVQELGENPNSTALIHSILGLARNLSMRVIVEGIENNTQLALIKKLGGNEGQGFLLGRPSPDPTGVLKEHYSIRPRKVSRVHEVVLDA
jgi:EAL domain-containing protein (putative c-di-GMP-specific phosphodiesterase class I)